MRADVIVLRGRNGWENYESLVSSSRVPGWSCFTSQKAESTLRQRGLFDCLVLSATKVFLI